MGGGGGVGERVRVSGQMGEWVSKCILSTTV